MEPTDNVLLRRPAITTVVLLTALLVPIAAVPYTLTRRHISRLTTQIDHLISANVEIQNAVSKSARDIALRQEQLERTTSLLEKSKNDIALLRRDISQTQAQLHSLQSATRAELQALLDEGKLTRQARLPVHPSAQPTPSTHICIFQKPSRTISSAWFIASGCCCIHARSGAPPCSSFLDHS